MNPATLTAAALAALLGVEFKAHKTDATLTSIRGSQPLVLAFLYASGIYKTLDKSALEQGKSYFWAHIPTATLDAVAVPIPKVEGKVEVAPIVPLKGVASA